MGMGSLCSDTDEGTHLGPLRRMGTSHPVLRMQVHTPVGVVLVPSLAFAGSGGVCEMAQTTVGRSGGMQCFLQGALLLELV